MLLRTSEESDAIAIDNLIRERFGPRADYGCLKNIKGRYILCFEDNLLVALSGLNKSGYYNGYEVDWTCTKLGYEHKGYVDNIFRNMLKDYDNVDIYCSAFKAYQKSEPNLYYILKKYGFDKVIEGRIVYDTRYMQCKENFDCKFYKGEGCRCSEDLYVRYAK